MADDILKQDSNRVGLYLAREIDGELPAKPVFATREPNTFDKFGGDYKTVARSPFNPSRQQRKGTTSDLDTSGGWNEDVTQNNMFDMLEGFFFAAMRRKAIAAVSAISAANNQFSVPDGSAFPVGSIVLAAGFDHKGNNGARHVTAEDATHITVAETLTAETIAVGAAKTLTRVGNKFAAGECALTLVGNLMVLTFSAFDPTTLGLISGEWGFVGGDLAASQFDGVKPGYGRVYAVDAHSISFDKFTSVIGAAGDTGANKSIEFYYGFLVKNEDDEDLIVKSTYTAERPLGKDADGTQSDNLQKFVLSQMKWNSPLSNKVTFDVTGVGLAYGKRTGDQGLLAKQANATIVKALGEEAFNTSLNVYRTRMSIIDPDSLLPTPLYAKCTEWTATINNNVTASKAQGDLGGFDTTVGQFDVSMTTTAYFTTVAAIQAIEDNADTTFDTIYAKHNAAIVIDIPLLTPGGGALTIAQNQPIMMPLTGGGAENEHGYTMLINFLPYVPSIGMAKGG